MENYYSLARNYFLLGLLIAFNGFNYFSKIDSTYLENQDI